MLPKLQDGTMAEKRKRGSDQSGLTLSSVLVDSQKKQEVVIFGLYPVTQEKGCRGEDPVRGGKNMEIVYASDDHYVQHMAVSIRSLIAHNQNEDLRIHILSDGITEDHLALIRQEITEAGKEAVIYPLEDLKSTLEKRVPGLDTGRFHITTLARLLLGSILPEEIHKVLYLDCDTVVLHSLEALYMLRLSGCTAAMAPEPTIYKEVRDILQLTPKDIYYNAGVLLLNLQEWRERKLEEESFSYYNQMHGRLPFNDQDILNHVLRNQTVTLGQRFNFFSNYYYFRYSTLLSLDANYGFCETKKTFHKAKHHPVIVHYAGDERPWIAGSMNHYGRAYDKYLAMTAFRNAGREEGKRGYMALYHLMNIATFVAPALRKMASSAYYQKQKEKQK